MAMRLEFRRFFAECTLDALAKLELCAALGSLEIGKTLPSQVFEFRDERLELFDALGKVVNPQLFRPHPLGFCPCHTMWESVAHVPWTDKKTAENQHKDAYRPAQACGRIYAAMSECSESSPTTGWRLTAG